MGLNIRIGNKNNSPENNNPQPKKSNMPEGFDANPFGHKEKSETSTDNQREQVPTSPATPVTPPPPPPQPVQPQIDMESIKRDLMESIKAEEAAEKKRREEDIRRREEELKKVEEELKEEKESISNNKKYKRKSKMLAKNNPSGNEDYYNNYKIRVRNQKMKSAAYTSAFFILVFGLLACNVYFMFFKKETPVSQIEQQIMQDRYLYLFPTDGVTEYLEKNLATLMADDVTITGGTGAQNWDIQNIRVRKFNLFSDSYANVFFSADMVTSIGTEEHNYILTLKYDYNTKTYSPASELVARTVQFNDTTEIPEGADIIWGFGDNKPYDDRDIEPLKQFLTQYYTMLYTNKSYPSASLKLNGDPNFDYNEYSFNFIDKVEFYPVCNYMGANCRVKYSVQSAEGLTYKVTNYLYIDGNRNDGYKITLVF